MAAKRYLNNRPLRMYNPHPARQRANDDEGIYEDLGLDSFRGPHRNRWNRTLRSGLAGHSAGAYSGCLRGSGLTRWEATGFFRTRWKSPLVEYGLKHAA